MTWRGDLDGRACVVSVAAQGRTRYVGEVRVRTRVGYRVRIERETAVSTRLFFVREAIATAKLIGWIYRLKRQTVLPAPALTGFCAVTKDPAWASQLLGDSQAMAATAELLNEKATPALAGSVYFSPTTMTGKVYYGSPNLQPHDLTVERTERMLDRLAKLAHAADRLPPPSAPARVTTLERLAEGRPYVAAFAFFGCVLTILGLSALAVAAIAWLLGG